MAARSITSPLRGLLRVGFYAAAAGVAALSLMPRASLPVLPVGDKVEHLLAYAALGLLGAATAHSRAETRQTIFGLVAFGATLELLQAFSPGRSPELADALLNTAGACLGGGAITLLRGCAARLAPAADRE
jgi:VanZ family protein